MNPAFCIIFSMHCTSSLESPYFCNLSVTLAGPGLVFGKLSTSTVFIVIVLESCTYRAPTASSLKNNTKHNHVWTRRQKEGEVCFKICPCRGFIPCRENAQVSQESFRKIQDWSRGTSVSRRCNRIFDRYIVASLL